MSSANILQVTIQGLSCSSCVGSIESQLSKVKGIIDVSVNLVTTYGTIHYDKQFISASEIIEKIDNLGYEATVISDGENNLKEVRFDDGSSSSSSDNTARSIRLSSYLSISGMTCSSCVSGIESALARENGIKDVSVSLLTNSASVVFDPNTISAELIVNKITEMGYEVSLINTTPMDLKTTPSSKRTGMSNPAVTISTLKKSYALLEKQRSRTTRNLGIRMIAATVFLIPTFIISMVFMYLPHHHPISMAMMKEVAPGLPVNSLIQFILATPVIFVIGYPIYSTAFKALYYTGKPQMDVLITVGMFSAYIYSLVAMGIDLTVGGKEAEMFFEISVFLVAFITLGRWMESLAKGKTSEALTKLAELQPENCVLVDAENLGKLGWKFMWEKEIDIEQVQVGDVLKVVPSGRIPVDGVIISGETYIDLSMLTGEPVPVFKSPTVSSSVTSGTINVGPSPIYILTTTSPSSSTLTSLLQLLQSSLSSKPKLQQTVDRVSYYFVPAILVLALVTFLVWGVLGWTEAYPKEWLPEGYSPTVFALMFAISVLVIACPCALGLSTPIAVMVSLGVAAKNGILIKAGAEVLEKCGQMDILVCDKTGTITKGQMVVEGGKVFDDPTNTEKVFMTSEGVITDSKAFYQLLYLVESTSAHPLAKAITSYARSKVSPIGNAETVNEIFNTDLIDVIETSDHPGRGITAKFIHIPSQKSFKFNIGNLNFVFGKDILLPPFIKDEYGSTTNFKSLKESEIEKLIKLCDANPIGTIVASSISSDDDAAIPHFTSLHTLTDPPRPETKAALNYLKKNGVEIVMLTGDVKPAAYYIADEVGIDRKNVVAGCLPSDKKEILEWLKSGNTLEMWNNRRDSKNPEIVVDLGDQQTCDVPPKSRKSTKTPIISFIGDGLNDAPSLALADISISLTSATDIATQTAGILLTRTESPLTSLPILHHLAKVIFSRIKLNLVFAFMFNVLGILWACGVLYPVIKTMLPPSVAGLAMAASSVGVVLSSLSLRLYKPPKIQQ